MHTMISLATAGALAVTFGTVTCAKAAQATINDVMVMFGTQGEAAFSVSELATMGRPFDRADQNGDGYLNDAEYVSNSPHFRNNPQGARGFLRASDTNGDGRISRAEYVQNRIITDEAKDIFARIDPSSNWSGRSAFGWSMERKTFVSSAYLGNATLAGVAFDAMDQDANGVLTLPEYLVKYGRWARAALPAAYFDGR